MVVVDGMARIEANSGLEATNKLAQQGVCIAGRDGIGEYVIMRFLLTGQVIANMRNGWEGSWYW